MHQSTVNSSGAALTNENGLTVFLRKRSNQHRKNLAFGKEKMKRSPAQ
jgi:hypothetical protein